MRRKSDLRGRREMTVGIGKELCLVESLTESSILNAQLVDEGTTLLPTPICFIGGCESGIEELRARFEGFYMTVGFKRYEVCIVHQGGDRNSRVSSLAKGSLSFTVLLGTFALRKGSSALWGVPFLV